MREETISKTHGPKQKENVDPDAKNKETTNNLDTVKNQESYIYIQRVYETCDQPYDIMSVQAAQHIDKGIPSEETASTIGAFSSEELPLSMCCAVCTDIIS